MADIGEIDSRIEHLAAMGFDPAVAERALRRAHNDVDLAVTMLTTGNVPEEDAFDILADATSPKSPMPGQKKSAASGGDQGPDHFREGVPDGAPVSAILDNRVHQLIQMGFDGHEAEKALQVANDDMDKAIEVLSRIDDLSA